MDNRKLKLNEIEVLRRRAVEAVVKHGETQKRALELFGFSQTSMSKYIKDYKRKGESALVYKKRGVKPGTYSKLSDEQFCAVKDVIINKTPDEVASGFRNEVRQNIIEYKIFWSAYGSKIQTINFG